MSRMTGFLFLALLTGAAGCPAGQPMRPMNVRKPSFRASQALKTVALLPSVTQSAHGKPWRAAGWLSLPTDGKGDSAPRHCGGVLAADTVTDRVPEPPGSGKCKGA